MNAHAPRPAFHFTTGEGWINSPLGVTWKDGQYHLFYQYVPGPHHLGLQLPLDRHVLG